MMSSGTCQINQIFLGEIASVQNYGAFVRIPGCRQQGLIHKSQVSTARVDDVADILRRGERVWCKVIEIDDSGKVGLSMKHVNQGDGKDLDPNGVERLQDEKRRKKMVPGRKREAIRLEAVLDATCTKCGTRGHLRSDCFVSPGGKTYDLLPEIEDRSSAENTRIGDTTARKDETNPSRRTERKNEKSSRRDSDSSDDDDNDDEDDAGERGRKRKKKNSGESEMKKRKKKKKEKKKRRRKEKKRDASRSDSESAKGGESSDKKSKKCKHSRSKHSD